MINIRSFRDLLRLFFIFKREVKITVLVTFVIVILGAFLLPNRYESTALLLVKPGRDTSTVPIELSDRQAIVVPNGLRDPLLDEERMLTGRPIMRMVAEKYLNELSKIEPETGVMASVKNGIKYVVRSVFEAGHSVLQFLGLAEKRTPVERMAEDLEKNFKVRHEQGSSVMELTFTWNDPVTAQIVLKTWIDEYQLQRTKTLGRVSLYGFYETEVKAIGANIISYKQQIQGYLNQLGAVSISQRLADTSQGLNDLRTERNNTIRAIASTKAGLDTLKTQLAAQPKTVSAGRELALNPNRQDLQNRINGKEVERQELLRSFKEQAPPVRAANEEINNLKQLLKEQDATIQRSESITPNPIYNRMQNVYADQQTSYARLQTQLAQQNAQLAQLESDRQLALKLEPELSRLQNELDAAQKSYALYTDSLEKARIDRELDNSQISNIATIEDATFNASRVFPKSMLMLLLAFPLSIVVGFLALYFFYLLDQRIHDGDKIEGRFGVPVWTSLPDLERAQDRSAALTANLHRIYGILPLGQVAEKGLAIGFTSVHRGEGVNFVISRLSTLLTEQGHSVRTEGRGPAKPGEIVLINASGVYGNQEAFVLLRDADQIVLVVRAEQTTVPMLEDALATLNTAFKKVDGVILNRRRFVVPEHVLNFLKRIGSRA
ncbi:exopolysaccharide transport family protein [Pseudomonas cichorii]|uniref:Exopolysaccharide transport family protein n=1 Tax=Pseudomonas lijiangensis TaxID=2995658 RepID=A0ABX8HL86_9PSED|nr:MULTISPECIES: exopolysaccharide transport family protein [Pseudomonas syringae group]MBX8491355.1 exopolysaccharide transport family protein [Pseudomonas cichorii]MBX8499524.1 exopolysaccharide transport family protein [Pseudomonas lijiangensis]MBX8505356.1 exopolysaccharide transport family protein [Pseudomonas lijiangensis]MBX8508446.1 exopolysaccharide transport family protein [Pseudomonas cichorii]MBX8523216.1 exopolysaccharide transport family protein [Pseudomonas cichorii]